MSGIYYKDKLRANVTIPNPQDTATADLEKVKIDGTTYDVTDADAIHSADVGVANGVAELDANGFVPQAQLPSYVDDVLEYASMSAFPATGESGKIYVALDTNKTYRWSGSAYVEISESLALGETNSTAYRGDRGKTAYDHSQTTSGNPHNVTKSDVGLGNVPNVATDDQTPTVTEASTRANLASGDSLKTIIGKIKKFFSDLKTVAFTGSFNDLTDQPTIPTVNNGTLTIQKNGTQVATFSANQSGNATANITVPTGDLASINKDGTSSTKYLRGDGTWQAFPSIPAAVAVKGDKESTYRTGNVNLTPANLGAVYTRHGDSSFGSAYTDVAYYYSGGTVPTYLRIKLPDDVATIWTMLNIEIFVRQYYDSDSGGKIIINCHHNSTSPYTWTGNAYCYGKLTNDIKVYGSDGKYVYIKGIGYYTTVIIEKMLIGDTARQKDFSTTSMDVVSSLPSTYQTFSTYTDVNSSNIGSQSVNYATSAGSATDSTKIPLAGSSDITGSLIPKTNNSISLGGASYSYMDVYTYSLRVRNSANAYYSTISPSSLSGNKRLIIPDENGTLATREWVQSTADMVTKTVTSNAGANMNRAVFYSQQRSGFIDIYISAVTNNIAVSSSYGNLKYASCSINIPTGLGWVGSNGFVVSATQRYSTGLNFVSLNNVTDSAISFFLTTAQAESAHQYNIYMHLVCLDF